MAGMALGLWRAASDQLLDLEAKIMQQVERCSRSRKTSNILMFSKIFQSKMLCFAAK